MEREDSLAVDLAAWDLEREASDRYKGYLVISRLKRVPDEAVKCNAFAREEEVRRFPSRHIESVKSPDGHVLRSDREMRKVFRVHFRDRWARCPDLLVQEFHNYLLDFPRLREAETASCKGCDYWMQSLWCVEVSWPQQITRTRWFTPRSLLKAAVQVCAYSDGYVQPLVRQGSHHIAEERGQAWEDLDDYRPIILHNTVKYFGPGLSEPFATCHKRSDRTWVELRCERKINPRQLAIGTRGPRGVRRRHRSHADQFGSVQGLW